MSAFSLPSSPVGKSGGGGSSPSSSSCCCRASSVASALRRLLHRPAEGNGVAQSPSELTLPLRRKEFGEHASRSRSRVIRRAETATQVGADGVPGTPSPTRLRVIQDECLKERYIVGDQAVGEGASGVVRVITDKKTKERRVLKTLALSSASSRQHWDDLFNEVEVYLRLDHPNICRLLEVFVEEECCHLIMELCVGKELFERWDGRGFYSESDACAAIAQMLDALQYMHSHKVCHRDLKLENWVYADATNGARLKLIDFGFSKVVTGDSRMTDTLGTVFYMAPEVLAGSYDFKCDIWSTGVIAYMLLTGEPPFGEFEDTDHEIMMQVMKSPTFKTSCVAWPHLSEDCKDFVRSLLTRDPEKRPTAKVAANHRWLTQRASHIEAPEISIEVLENMRSFASTNVIKRAACCLIAYSMSVDETDHLEAQFKRLDKERNGTILVHELVDALKENLGMSEVMAQELFSKLDLTGDRQLNYSEFLAAACQRRFLAQEGLIQEAFRRFDVDHTGYISLDNLRSVLGDEYNGTRVEDILAQVDSKGNGVIEYDEFVRALMDLGTAAPGQVGGGPEPEQLDLMKRISRAFDFTSVGSPRNRSVPRRRSAGRSDRRCVTEVSTSFPAGEKLLLARTISEEGPAVDEDDDEEDMAMVRSYSDIGSPTAKDMSLAAMA